MIFEIAVFQSPATNVQQRQKLKTPFHPCDCVVIVIDDIPLGRPLHVLVPISAMFSPMFPSLDDFVAGAAKNSAGAEPSNNNNALETPKRTTKKKQHDMCHQAVMPAPATPPRFQGPNLTNQPVAVVYTGKKKSRSVAEADDVTDEISPIGNEDADESVAAASSPTNLEKVLGMEDENIPPSRSSKGNSSKIGKPPKTSRRDNKSSKNNNKKKRQGAASSKSALPFLLGYEQMVRTQDAEDWATAAHLRPIFTKLRYLGGDTTVAPAANLSSHQTSNAVPASIMSGSDASVNSAATNGTTLTNMTDRTDAEREADALSYLSSSSGQHIDKKCDGTILTFAAMASSLSILSSKEPNEEEMAMDRSLMLLLQTIVDATSGMGTNIGPSRGVTFPEFLHGYKTISTAMQTIQRFPSTTAEGQNQKAQTRDRAHQMIQSFVRVSLATKAPVGTEDAKDRGSVKDEDNVEVKQDGEIAIIDLGQEKEELASINPMKIVILHMVVALVCGTCASTMWAENVPPRNVSVPTDVVINESEAVAIEQEVQPATPAFNKRSAEHFVLRKKIRTIGARSKRWMKSAHACRESLELTQAEFEEASLTIMEMIDKNKEPVECNPPEIVSDDAIMNVVAPADLPRSIHAPVRKRHARMHILSAMGGATLTTLASKVLVDGSVKVVSSAATSSPLALVVGALRGASMSSLASRALVEGTAKVAAGTTARSFAMTRVIGAAIGSPFALVMSVGMVAFVIASVHAAGNDDGESIDV